MKKMVAGVLALFGALMVTPAFADPITPPSHVKMMVVAIGKNVNGVVPVSDGTRIAQVGLSGCDIQWTTGEQFYVMTAKEASPIVVKRVDFDYLWIKSGNDWPLTMSTLISANAVCIVSAVK